MTTEAASSDGVTLGPAVDREFGQAVVRVAPYARRRHGHRRRGDLSQHGLGSRVLSARLACIGPSSGPLRLGCAAVGLRGDRRLGGELDRPRAGGRVAREHQGRLDYARGLGAPRLGVVGLRLGATLAAAELERGGPVDDLVFWDACATGRAFLREQAAFAAFRRTLPWAVEQPDIPPPPGEESPVEAPGTVFSAATAADSGSRRRSLGTIGVWPPVSSSWPAKGGGPGVRCETAWACPTSNWPKSPGRRHFSTRRSSSPVPTLERIVSWFSEVGGPAGAARLAGPASVGTAPGARSARRQRTTTRDRPGAASSACSASRRTAARRSAPTVVFLNVGLIPHHGPGRLWVELARACAASGNVRSLRVDLNGLGDSPTREGGTELRSFPAGGARGPAGHPPCGRPLMAAISSSWACARAPITQLSSALPNRWRRSA